jgi:hypothetical protein
MVQDLEEMVALIPEFITANILTYHRKQLLKFSVRSSPATEMFCRKDTQLVANRAIQVLREATVLNPDLVISDALATCLAARFKTTLAMNDYEEAIAILDRIVATHSPGNSPTRIQRDAMMLISFLLGSRLNSFSRPEYLEDAVHRIRTFVPCLPDEDRTKLASILNSLMHRRFDYFGVAGNSGGAPPNPHFNLRCRARNWWRASSGYQARVTNGRETVPSHEVGAAIINGEITDVEAAVEHSRKFVPLQQSRDQWSSSSELAKVFAESSSMRINPRRDRITSMKQLPRFVIFAKSQPSIR